MGEQPYGVLIIHGFTSSLDCVSGIEPPFKSLGLPTRVPVLRGHGAESPEALRGVTWHDWVADAEAALKDLLTEVDQVVVFGHRQYRRGSTCCPAHVAAGTRPATLLFGAPTSPVGQEERHAPHLRRNGLPDDANMEMHEDFVEWSGWQRTREEANQVLASLQPLLEKPFAPIAAS